METKKRTQIMIVISSLLLFLLVSGTLHAQNPIAQLKFEDAEKAFNAGDYKKALHYVEETEALAGVTSKTLYLTIVSQDKLVAGGDSDLLEPLKSNVQKYLTALASQEIDDKYRTVYEISKKLEDYAVGRTSPTYANAGNTTTFSNKSVANILQACRKAVIGNINPELVHSIIIEREAIRNGSPVGTTTIKKEIGKFFMEVKMSVISTKIVYSNGTGYMTMAGRQMPLTQIEKYKQFTTAGNLIPRLFDSKVYANATASQTVFNGKQANVVRLPGNELYFDPHTHLIIAQKITGAYGYITTKTFQDYTFFQGIKLPATIITETITGTGQQVPGTSVFNKTNQQESQKASQTTAAIGLPGRSRKKKKKKKRGLAVLQMQQVAKEIAKSGGVQSGGNTITEITKIKSVKINEPISDEVFK